MPMPKQGLKISDVPPFPLPLDSSTRLHHPQHMDWGSLTHGSIPNGIHFAEVIPQFQYSVFPCRWTLVNFFRYQSPHNYNHLLLQPLLVSKTTEFHPRFVSVSWANSACYHPDRLSVWAQ